MSYHLLTSDVFTVACGLVDCLDPVSCCPSADLRVKSTLAAANGEGSITGTSV